MFDLTAATDEMARLVTGLRDDQLTAPTPCAEWTVADLLAHVHQFAVVFADNARRQPAHPPATLVADWRAAIPAQLRDLARAWSDPAAWQGRVSAGGVEMAAADNAVVAIEELVVHGWDLATATEQALLVGDDQLAAVEPFFDLFGPEPFGPAVPTTPSSSRLDRIIAATGRNPAWTHPGRPSPSRSR